MGWRAEPHWQMAQPGVTVRCQAHIVEEGIADLPFTECAARSHPASSTQAIGRGTRRRPYKVGIEMVKLSPSSLISSSSLALILLVMRTTTPLSFSKTAPETPIAFTTDGLTRVYLPAKS